MSDLQNVYEELNELRTLVNAAIQPTGHGTQIKLLEERIERLSHQLEDLDIKQRSAEGIEKSLHLKLTKLVSAEVGKRLKKDFSVAIDPVLDAVVQHERDTERAIKSGLLTVSTDAGTAVQTTKAMAEASAEGLVDLCKNFSRGV